jgi:hypothetical protein
MSQTVPDLRRDRGPRRESPLLKRSRQPPLAVVGPSPVRSWLLVLAIAACRGGDRVPVRRDAQAVTPAVDAAAADSGPSADRAAVLDAVLATGRVIAGHGCPPRVMRAGFADAPILCLGATAAALISMALEAPARTPAAIEQLHRIVDLALIGEARAAFRSSGSMRVLDRDLPRSVLYRGLLALILAGLERLSPDNARTGLFDALAASLAADLDRGWVATYGPDQIWPCDHAPAASALRLHGRLRGNSASALAADHLVARLRALVAAFPTRVDRTGKIVDPTERGTALAFTAGFLLPGQPETAALFATRFVSHCDRAVVSACREWPRGTDHAPDPASGPIIAGYSVGATALGLAATRALAGEWNAALLHTAEAMGAGTLDSGRQALESAFYRWGQTARPW